MLGRGLRCIGKIRGLWGVIWCWFDVDFGAKNDADLTPFFDKNVSKCY